MKLKLALFLALGLAGANAMACYTVYDRNNRVVYNELQPPVDMSLPLHQSLPQRFPGAHMVFDANGSCPASTVGAVAAARVAASAAPAPLLTDAATAQALRMPHTEIASNVALVPGYAAARLDLPTFNVIPADTAVAAARPVLATTMMGAGPAPAARGNTVITELRDPPMTITQRGKQVSVQR